jgi:hypothetical protein
MNPVDPKKLLLTKWTAVKPVAKQKHFLVSWVSHPEPLTYPIEMVKIKASFLRLFRRLLGVPCKFISFGGSVGFDPYPYCARPSPTYRSAHRDYPIGFSL